MRREGKVLYGGIEAGRVWQDDIGYGFAYHPIYLAMPHAQPISLTLPLQEASYLSKTMIAFFDGLIAEGWLLEADLKVWHLDRRDRMGLLLTVCQDCVGAVSVVAEPDPADVSL